MCIVAANPASCRLGVHLVGLLEGSGAVRPVVVLEPESETEDQETRGRQTEKKAPILIWRGERDGEIALGLPSRFCRAVIVSTSFSLAIPYDGISCNPDRRQSALRRLFVKKLCPGPFVNIKPGGPPTRSRRSNSSGWPTCMSNPRLFTLYLTHAEAERPTHDCPVLTQSRHTTLIEPSSLVLSLGNALPPMSFSFRVANLFGRWGGGTEKYDETPVKKGACHKQHENRSRAHEEKERTRTSRFKDVDFTLATPISATEKNLSKREEKREEKRGHEDLNIFPFPRWLGLSTGKNKTGSYTKNTFKNQAQERT